MNGWTISTGISLSIVFGIPATATLRPRRLISCQMRIGLYYSGKHKEQELLIWVGIQN